MRNYYLFSIKETPNMASAFAPEETPLAHDLIQNIDQIDEVPFELELFKLSSGRTGLIKSTYLDDLQYIWLDYQPNSLAWPLFSERLKEIFSRNLSGLEGLDWIKARINGNDEQRVYFIPRFEKKLDVIDENKTKYITGTDRIIVPHFSSIKIDKYAVFHKPQAHNFWKITPELYISDDLKKAIQKERIIGVSFEKVIVV